MVVLFGQPSCPGTARARHYLRGAGVTWRERDVSADPAAQAEMRRWGAFATPLLVVAGRLPLFGFDPDEVGRALREEGSGDGR